MKIEKLLFVTKFEELGFDAVHSLLSLTTADLNHVVFVNVIERDRFAMSRVGYRKDEEIRLREAANIRFIDWSENLFEQGLEVGVYIVVGALVSEVIKAAQKEESDLIVIGRSHKGMLEHLYSGSDVTELLRRAATPVLVYKHLSATAISLEKPFDRPLLAIDWSPASLRAVEYLKQLGNVVSQISVVHVAGEKDLKGTSAMAVQKTRKETRQKLEEICTIFEGAGIDARAHVYIGDPDDEIEKAARDCQATMIVLGSSAKSAWEEKWLGSTPRKYAEESIYPTLLIPPEKKPGER
ncbi:MAG: universal stress protein [Deltaproteobacteria bacterium]|jgi:nucleotide-binding universal stress UspA family protein|nr:universal stress protein [Deltaproteobacteria bacterium]